MKEYLDRIDTTTTGGRYDVTPLVGNYQAFSTLLDDMLELCREIEYDTVAGIDALGFILGSAIAGEVGAVKAHKVTEGTVGQAGPKKQLLASLDSVQEILGQPQIIEPHIRAL